MAVRVVAAAVLLPLLAGFGAMVALVALLGPAAGAPWSPERTPRVAALLWLAAHQVPLDVGVGDGAVAPLGVLPLLPTLGLGCLLAGAARGAAERLAWRTPPLLAILTAAFAVPHGVAGALVALAAPSERMSVSPAEAVVGCAGIAAAAAVIGGLRSAGLDNVLAPLAPTWAIRGVRAGLRALRGLLTVGALCVLAALLLSAPELGATLATWAPFTGGATGVTLVSVAYLPNAVVAALSWLAGPGLSVGAVSITPFGADLAPLPAVPLLAALPDGPPPSWLPVVVLLPAAIGILTGRSIIRAALTSDTHAAPATVTPATGASATRGSEITRLAVTDTATTVDVPPIHSPAHPSAGARTHLLGTVVTAGAVAALGCTLLATLAGGPLGVGALDPVRIPATSLTVAVFAWIVIPAALVVALSRS
ncbi:MAG TPA: DUF6350 family protein [Pseudonocardiaceae bacterium]